MHVKMTSTAITTASKKARRSDSRKNSISSLNGAD